MGVKDRESALRICIVTWLSPNHGAAANCHTAFWQARVSGFSVWIKKTQPEPVSVAEGDVL